MNANNRLGQIAIMMTLFGVMGYIPTTRAQSKQCPQEMAIRAESDTDIIVSWDAAFRSFRRFRQCDDGAIAEGFSDRISRLLSEDWNTFPRLLQIVAKNKAFEMFVLKHLDDTVPAKTLDIVASNARTQCPSQGRRLCRLIVHAAESTSP
jgi:hypothetical protein